MWMRTSCTLSKLSVEQISQSRGTIPRVSAGVMGTTRRSDPTMAGAPEAVIPSPVRGIDIKRRWGCEWVRDPVSESPRKLARIYSGQSLDL